MVMNHLQLPQKILIVGLGLIGGSIARALKSARPEINITAVDSNSSYLSAAIKDKVIDASGTLAELGPKAEIIIVALPPVATAKILKSIAEYKSTECIVTDVASVKSEIVAAANALGERFASVFVPAHPIAGSEQSGFAASSSNLFHERKLILTPQPGTSPSAVALVNSLWRSLGADVLGMSLESHDEVLAATSHLPHLLAFSIVDVLLQRNRSDDIFRYAAGGFADFSRLASSDPQMWSDIFCSNSDSIVKVLDDYVSDLVEFKQALEKKDSNYMLQKLARAKETRNRFIHRFYSGGEVMQQETAKISFIVKAGGTVGGSIRVPGDKSISHRTIILGSIADGVTQASGFLEGEDALKTVAALQEMGVTIVGPESGKLVIYGVGKHGLQAPRKPLDMGNSGTAMRLLAGLLAAQKFDAELVGDASLSQRPMKRVADPLTEMGAAITTTSGGTPPLHIKVSKLKAIDYALPVASAQIKSCLLLAGLYADGVTRITEPEPCRDHTERMLTGFGYDVTKSGEGRVTELAGGGELQATTIDIPADISSAAFFMVAAAITPGAQISLEHVGVNPTRTGVIQLLRLMGADITLSDEHIVGGEPVATITVKHSKLTGITIPQDQIPLAIDEFPVLFVAAACAEGTTVLRGAEELRVKESDRIEAMANGLNTLGIITETFPDGISIEGGQLVGGTVESLGDHRIAMSFVIAALRATSTITVNDCANVNTSFPGFVQLAQQAGIQISTGQN